ncbi:MAG: sel1 repeat family protein [Epsilonproteobacteria bacterium]|nr:sel1 repeat family protein [Campylobacterota bacterium]
MKTLITAILILTVNLSANTTNIYSHAKDVRVSKKVFFAQRAAKKGNVQAQFDLAIAYATGNGIEKDETKAFYWFHKSARAGHVEAKYYMGVSFLQGRGVRKDAHLARYWFKQASKAGHKKAIFYLARVEKSLNKSNKYITENYLSKI